MPTDESRWEEMFAVEGAFWRHPGHPECPYARLSSGLISDGFFNGGKVQENSPYVLGLAARKLWTRAGEAARTIGATRVIGAAEGATVLSTRIAEEGKLRSAYAVPISPTSKDVFRFERQEFDKDETLVLAEDTATTGRTLLRLRDAALAACPTAKFAPAVLVLCNRSGLSHIDGMQIISLINPSFKTWEEGKNPYTLDGQELVPPLSPKGRENWKTLTHPYA